MHSSSTQKHISCWKDVAGHRFYHSFEAVLIRHGLAKVDCRVEEENRDLVEEKNEDDELKESGGGGGRSVIVAPFLAFLPVSLCSSVLSCCCFHEVHSLFFPVFFCLVWVGRSPPLLSPLLSPLQLPSLQAIKLVFLSMQRIVVPE